MAQNKKPMKENVENSAFGGAMREEALRVEANDEQKRGGRDGMKGRDEGIWAI